MTIAHDFYASYCRTHYRTVKIVGKKKIAATANNEKTFISNGWQKRLCLINGRHFDITTAISINTKGIMSQ